MLGYSLAVPALLDGFTIFSLKNLIELVKVGAKRPSLSPVKSDGSVAGLLSDKSVATILNCTATRVASLFQ